MNYLILVILGLLSATLVCLYRDYVLARKISLNKYLKNSKQRLLFVGIALFLTIIMLFLNKEYNFMAAFFIYSLMFVILTAIALIDFLLKVIPDSLVIAGIMVGGIGAFISPEVSWFDALSGMLLAGGIFLVLFIITKHSLGFGDVKLFVSLGLCLGLERVLSAMLLSIILCALTGVVLMSINYSNKKKMLPFAPFALVGTIIAVFL